MRTAEEVADRIVKGVNYDSFTDGILKDIGKSYRAHPYKIQNAKGKGTGPMWCWGKGDGEDGLFKV